MSGEYQRTRSDLMSVEVALRGEGAMMVARGRRLPHSASSKKKPATWDEAGR